MADTGFVFPDTTDGSRAISGAIRAWISPDNIKADDGSETRWITGGGGSESSFGVAASNFDFSSIPAGATIDGIEVRCGDYSHESGGATIWDVVKLILADDADGSENKNSVFVSPTTSLQTDEAGGVSDLWSETINLSDVQDVDWGWFVGQFDSAASIDHFIDFMQMKVYYTPLNPTITSVNAGSAWTDGDSNIEIVGTDLF